MYYIELIELNSFRKQLTFFCEPSPGHVYELPTPERESLSREQCRNGKVRFYLYQRERVGLSHSNVCALSSSSSSSLFSTGGSLQALSLPDQSAQSPTRSRLRQVLQHYRNREFVFRFSPPIFSPNLVVDCTPFISTSRVLLLLRSAVAALPPGGRD